MVTSDGFMSSEHPEGRKCRDAPPGFLPKELTIDDGKTTVSRETKYLTAARAAKRKKTLIHLPQQTRRALGKQAAKAARGKR
jgi:hypothetical protein